MAFGFRGASEYAALDLFETDELKKVLEIFDIWITDFDFQCSQYELNSLQRKFFRMSSYESECESEKIREKEFKFEKRKRSKELQKKKGI